MHLRFWCELVKNIQFMITIFKERIKVNYFKILQQCINFYLIYNPNKCLDRQTLNCRSLTLLATASPCKQDLLNNNNDNNIISYGNWSTHWKIMPEQRFEKDFDAAL